ncbi:MAG: transposase family protein [Bacteroidetes bacterium]|nr:transposase family protein [Bacteroidota bacterium]
MSTSLLYHAFGLTDQQYLKAEYKEGTVLFHIRTKDSKLKCSNCYSRDVIKKGTVERIFRTLPIGLKPVYLVAHVQRLQCNDCGLIRQERLSYADEKKAIPVE